MAKKKKKKGKGGKGKNQGNWQLRLVLIMLLVTGIVFLPTTVLLVIGMLPTPVAFLVGTANKSKFISVGAMNFAACSPFVVELWSMDHTFDATFSIVTNPVSVIVMYGGAAIGYLINWSLTGIVSVFLVEQAKGRMKAIQKQQEELIQRWGPEVRGDRPLDKEGFYMEDDTQSPQAKATQPSSPAQKPA